MAPAYPQHTFAALRVLLRMAITRPGEMLELDAFLTRHADALTRPRCDVPDSFVQLAHVLTVCGGVAIARPFCARCGRTTHILPHRTIEGLQCLSCRHLCAGCGTRTHTLRATPRGQLCSWCRHGRTGAARPDQSLSRECSVCTRPTRTWVRLPLGPTCKPCHTAIVRAPAACARCAAVLPLIGANDAGVSICGPCANGQAAYPCHHGGHADGPHTATRCHACALVDHLTCTLAGPDGHVSEQLKPLWENLFATSKPTAMITWLAQGPAPRQLRNIARCASPITHELLDTQPQGQALNYVRDLLSTNGVLPARDDEHMSRAESWLGTTLAAAPEHHRTVLNRFARWYLLPHARRPARLTGARHTSAATLRASGTAALRLLARLDAVGTQLEQLTQTLLDEWIDTGGGHHRYLYPFITWCHHSTSSTVRSGSRSRPTETTQRTCHRKNAWHSCEPASRPTSCPRTCASPGHSCCCSACHSPASLPCGARTSAATTSTPDYGSRAAR
jgi:hypothetical protein